MTPRERDYVAALCATRAGLEVETDRSYLVESRLGQVARREGFASVSELVRTVRDRHEERLVWAVVEAMTPAASGFFRDPAVFEALADDLQVRASVAPVRVWSAACGAGEEVYSLAMLLAERGVEGVELFASDLGERRLEKAQTGLYTTLEAQQGLSAQRLVRHFANAEGGFVVEAGLRRRIRWRRVNLLEVPAGVGAFDLILCRYVLAALTEASRTQVLDHLGQALKPGGRLVLGLRESRPAGYHAVAGRPGVFEPAPGAQSAAAA